MMKNKRGNYIDPKATDLPRRLKEYRRQRAWPRAELARRAGIAWMTAKRIEDGKPVRGDTLDRIAKALGVDPDELLGGTPSESIEDRVSRRRGILLVVSTLILSVGLAGIATVHRYPSTVVRHHDRILSVSTDYGVSLWEDSLVWAYQVYDGNVAYGVSSEAEGGGTLVVRKLATGDTLWVDRPDLESLARVFDRAVLERGGYHCRHLTLVQLDGSGPPEIAVAFNHTPFYPSYVRIYRWDDDVVGTYHNYGHITDMKAIDTDGDGKEELVVGGYNNGEAYRGATVILLDEDHCSGASSDSLVLADCPLQDDSLVRIVFPAYRQAYMDSLNVTCLSVHELDVTTWPTTSPRIVTAIGPAKGAIRIDLDTELRPIPPVTLYGDLRVELNKWLPAHRPEPDYFEKWLTQHRRFGALTRQDVGQPVVSSSSK